MAVAALRDGGIGLVILLARAEQHGLHLPTSVEIIPVCSGDEGVSAHTEIQMLSELLHGCSLGHSAGVTGHAIAAP